MIGFIYNSSLGLAGRCFEEGVAELELVRSWLGGGHLGTDTSVRKGLLVRVCWMWLEQGKHDLAGVSGLHKFHERKPKEGGYSGL